MNIAVIDNYDSFVYNLVRYLREETSGEVRVFSNDKVDFDYLETCDGILLSPGPGIPEEAGQMPEVIAKFHDRKKILGVCLGHQALGEYWGMKLEQALPIHHGQASLIDIDCSSKLFAELPAKIEVGRYHSWRVQNKAPDFVSISAHGPQKDIMAFEHKQLPIYGVQFHPESILTPEGRQIIRNWINI